MSAVLSRLRGLAAAQRSKLLETLNPVELAALDADWREWAHAGQRFPPLAGEGADWRTWVLMAGRGFGKTRTGAAWVHDLVRGHATPRQHPREGGDLGRRSASSPEAPAFAGAREREPVRIALVAATVEEARRIMVEGPSGLLATAPACGPQPRFEPSRVRVVWPGLNAVASLYSGANPAGLRGPEHHFAWCDELAKWRHPDMAWDMLQLGLRLGEFPRALVTTTPRAGVPVLKRLLAAADTVVTGGSSDSNPHVAEGWVAAMRATLGHSRLGRQELDGVLVEDVAGSLWPRALIERCRGSVPRDLRRVVVGVDPPASAAGTCGIVVCGIDGTGVGHVLADRSAGGLSPEGWARAVAAAAEAYGADRVVAETNQGGDMVRAVLHAAGISLPITPATATRGKSARAEPVAGLFESGRARLAGRFPELEEQLTGLVPAGYDGPGNSPDRADAMVWALWALLIAPRAEPRVWVG